jgi:hypothetical protein
MKVMAGPLKPWLTHFLFNILIMRYLMQKKPKLCLTMLTLFCCFISDFLQWSSRFFGREPEPFDQLPGYLGRKQGADRKNGWFNTPFVRYKGAGKRNYINPYREYGCQAKTSNVQRHKERPVS